MAVCFFSLETLMGVTIFIDESGTLPDPKDRVIIVAAVGTKSPSKIELIIKTVRKKGKFKKLTGELKFYTAGDKTKTAFFKEIAREQMSIFVLIVEKMGRKIADTPQHFAVLCWLLLSDVFSFYLQIKEIVFDRHFHRDKDIEKFNQLLQKLIKNLPDLKHVDSKKNKKVNVADMVAGAVLAKETGKEDKFYKMFKKQIISETRINWPEAKRRLIKKIA